MMRTLGVPLLIGFLCFTGCGYTPVDSTRLFGQTAIILAPVTENAPSGLAGELTRSLSQVMGTGATQFTTDRARATAVLTGRVITTRTRGASITSTDRASEAFIFETRVEMKLISSDTQSILWQVTLPASESFRQVTGDASGPIETETARRLAIGRLAEALALEIREHLLIASMSFVSEES